MMLSAVGLNSVIKKPADQAGFVMKIRFLSRDQKVNATPPRTLRADCTRYTVLPSGPSMGT